MKLNRAALIALMIVFLLPLSALADGVLDFNISSNPPFSGILQITSVQGSGGMSNSGATLGVSSGLLNVASGGWLSSSGGTIDITATGTIGALSLSGTLLTASFTSVTPAWGPGGLMVTLDGLAASINPTLAGYFGLPDTASSGSVYISGSSAVLAIHPTVSAAEFGGVLSTLILLGMAGLCLAAGSRFGLFRCVH